MTPDGWCPFNEELVMKFLVFPTPIGLYTFNLGVKEVFNMSLGYKENVVNISPIIHEIDPHEFVKIINETNIIFGTTNKNRDRAPNIGKNKFEWCHRPMM